jgi:cytolysin (calcineurin-like family phosphatase)
LQFLAEDLASEVGDSGRPVILMQHYGFDGGRDCHPAASRQQISG